MRGLYAQYLLPPAVLLGGIAAGTVAGSVVGGTILGVVLAIVMAGLLARSAGRRLRRIERIARQDAVLDLNNEAWRDVHDQIDHALVTVARQVAQTEQRLRAARQLLTQQNQVLDQMNDGLMLVSRDGRVTYANIAAGSLFGGRNPTGRTFMSVTRDHELYQAVRRCLESGETQHYTLEIAGEARLIDAVAIRLSDGPAEALVMLRDITEVARLQNLRRDFVSNVSHELRTPLSTIKILTETLLDIRADDEEAAGFLSRIDNEVDSMTTLVRDLLDLSRLETTGARLALREIDVALLVHDVRDRMRPLAERHDVDVIAAASDEAGSLVCDERRLHQALINLITNAIVHTPPGGDVTIGAERDEDGVIFYVRDTGTGIPAGDLPRVWERFFKTDKARTGPGTGLGLAIVKHIVQAHSGSVSASSEVGKGSEFRMTIPHNVGPVAKLPPAPERWLAPS